MPTKAFFDGPYLYKNKFDFYEQGGSPLLLQKFIDTIEANISDITEVNISWYLYNNKILHQYLKSISQKGIQVNVITIPLEGYDDNRSQLLTDLSTGRTSETKFTKYELAKKIFSEMYRSEEYPNFKMYFFSHMYVRSKNVKAFSRGALPYSLHVKSAYIKKKQGYLLLMSSSNLAVRDLVKEESMICIEDEDGYESMFRSFYKDLVHNSTNIKDYTKILNTSCNTFDTIDFDTSSKAFISAPFYYDSANILEKKLSDLISKAKDRIIICAQHLAAFEYKIQTKNHSSKDFDTSRKGILGVVLDKAKQGVEVSCYSQTFVPPNELEIKFLDQKFRRPANTKSFQKFYAQLDKIKEVEYFVNENIHSKFIIIDDTLIFCTYNFTPTQFIYVDQVNISSFKHMPNLQYQGIHCEVAVHVLVQDPKVVVAFVNNMARIRDDKATIKVH